MWGIFNLRLTSPGQDYAARGSRSRDKQNLANIETLLNNFAIVLEKVRCIVKTDDFIMVNITAYSLNRNP